MRSILIIGTLLAATLGFSQLQGHATTYAGKYYGRKTATGHRLTRHDMTVAVPPSRRGSRFPRHKYGSLLKITYRGRSVIVKVNDLCPGGTYDLTYAGMSRLLGRFSSTKVKVTVAPK